MVLIVLIGKIKAWIEKNFRDHPSFFPIIVSQNRFKENLKDLQTITFVILKILNLVIILR